MRQENPPVRRLGTTRFICDHSILYKSADGRKDDFPTLAGPELNKIDRAIGAFPVAGE
jgi:hypothetical protein